MGTLLDKSQYQSVDNVFIRDALIPLFIPYMVSLRMLLLKIT